MIFTENETLHVNRFLAGHIHNGPRTEGDYLLALLRRAAALGHEPSVSQRMDSLWEAAVHDPREPQRDAYIAIAGSPLLAIVGAIMQLPVSEDG